MAAVAELAMIGAVLPFLALIADPTLAARYSLLQSVSTLLGWDADKSILLPTTAVRCHGVGSGAVRTFLTWAV